MIHMLIGSTGAGKTTYALKLAKERGAVHFAVDEFMHTLFFPDLSDEISFDWAMLRIERCEKLIWQLTERLLAQNTEVILEISMSTHALRDKQRQRAQQTGHDFVIHYLDIDRETRRQRVLDRNRNKGESYYFDVDEGMFDFVENMFEPPTEEELKNAVIVTS